MKKTVSISLASTPFIIEEDAYQILDQYLSGIRSHFANIPDASEVVSDIEARIAEQFLESGEKVVTQTEVGTVITAMGSVHDFEESMGSSSASDEGNTTGSEKPEANKKQLYRNPEDKVIAGVASGLAAYLGVDAVWVRIVFILLVLGHGFGLLIYIAFWLSMPEAKSASQRLAMSGIPVTLGTLSERIKERSDEIKKDGGMLKRIVTLPFTAVGIIFKFISTKLLPIFGRLIGALISVGATVALLAVSICLGLLITHRGGEYVVFPLQDVLSPSMVLVTAISAYVALVIPLLFLLFLGNTLILRRKFVTGSAMLALSAIWFLAIVVGVVSGISTGTKIADYVATSPEYREETRTVEQIAQFSEISAKNGVRIKYTQGTTSSVALEGRAKDLDNISITSDKGVLRIEPQRKERVHFCIFCDFGIPTVVITAPAVTKFSGDNGVYIEGKDILSKSALEIKFSNGSRGKFSSVTDSLTATLENTAYLELSGSANTINLSGENGIRIDGSKFTGDSATISIINASRVEIGVTKTLSVYARNGASIRYAGSPVLTKDARNASDIRSSEIEFKDF